MPIQTKEQATAVFKTPRDLTRTSAGRVHREMVDLQRQPDLSKSETGRLKELRRDWNRNLKYTSAGMALSGAASPLDAQNRFMRSTEDFRQLNPQAYGRMYPYSQAAMKLGEYGGLMGLGVRALTGRLKKTIRKRFPGIDEVSEIDEVIPPTGIAPLVPEHIRQQALFDINETVEGGEGIFGGTGQSLLEEIDVEKYIPPISNRVLAEWFITIKPEADLTVERTEELIRDLAPTTKQLLIEQYKESQ